MTSPEPNTRLNTGCGYYLIVAFTACLLLFVNGFLVWGGLESYEYLIPNELRDVRSRQSLQFVLPVLLIFMEYWLYDQIVDRLHRTAA